MKPLDYLLLSLVFIWFGTVVFLFLRDLRKGSRSCGGCCSGCAGCGHRKKK